jgi:hypothetical protein
MDSLREKEICKLLLEQIKNESSKTIKLNIELFNRYLTPEGESFISKMTKGRQDVRNSLLDNIKHLEKHIEIQETTEYINILSVLKDKLEEINRNYYNSNEFMSYLMVSGKEGEEMLKHVK